MIRKRVAGIAVAVAVVAASVVAIAGRSTSAQAVAAVPAFDHIVLVMFENKASSQITASSAPYFQSLAAQGAGRPYRAVDLNFWA